MIYLLCLRYWDLCRAGSKVKRGCRTIFLFLLVGGGTSFHPDSSLAQETLFEKNKPYEKSKSHFNSQWLQQQYITPRETSNHSQNYSQLTLGGQLSGRESTSEYNLEGHVQSLFGNRLETYWYVKEAYYGWKWQDQHTLTLGRKLKNWSKVDQEWATGLWESSYRADGYQFLQQGLTGVSYSYDKPMFRIKVFASPFFTPDQGPLVSVRNGQLVSNNRWFNNDINEVMIGEVRSPLVYKLETPDVSEVILQESFALGISWGQADEGWQFSLSHADKPINQLYIGVRPLHSLSPSNVNKITELYVIPQVHRHRLSTAELHYTQTDLNVWMSLNWDRPYLENTPESWITPTFVEERIVATGLSWKWNRQKFTLGYINRESGVREAASSFIGGDLSHLSDRYVFREASLIRFSRKDSFRGFGTVEFSLQWIRSLANEADMLSFKWDYSYFKNWSWSIGGDIIGSQQVDSDDFFSRNRSNDRLYGGISYAF